MDLALPILFAGRRGDNSECLFADFPLIIYNRSLFRKELLNFASVWSRSLSIVIFGCKAKTYLPLKNPFPRLGTIFRTFFRLPRAGKTSKEKKKLLLLQRRRSKTSAVIPHEEKERDFFAPSSSLSSNRLYYGRVFAASAFLLLENDVNDAVRGQSHLVEGQRRFRVQLSPRKRRVQLEVGSLFEGVIGEQTFEGTNRVVCDEIQSQLFIDVESHHLNRRRVFSLEPRRRRFRLKRGVSRRSFRGSAGRNEFLLGSLFPFACFRWERNQFFGRRRSRFRFQFRQRRR